MTPDSFSDGGVNFRPDDAIATARRMLDEGAAIVDVGAESTRPGAEPAAQVATARAKKKKKPETETANAEPKAEAKTKPKTERRKAQRPGRRERIAKTGGKAPRSRK